MKKISTLRSHPKREGRPIVIISGDGSPEGTRVKLEAGEVPGPVVRFSVKMDTDGDAMASGNLICQTEDGPVTISAWIRFGQS
jgi:hypothetical protein